jgi:restriction system protein
VSSDKPLPQDERFSDSQFSKNVAALQALRDRGILSKEEFEEKHLRLLLSTKPQEFEQLLTKEQKSARSGPTATGTNSGLAAEHSSYHAALAGCGLLMGVIGIGLITAAQIEFASFSLIGCACCFGIRANEKRKRGEHALDAIVENVTRSHLRTLRVQLDQRRIVDPYGNFDTSKADEHIRYFVTNVVFRDFKQNGFNPDVYAADTKKMAKIHQKIYGLIIEDMRHQPALDISNIQSGIDYEHFCKRILETHDWQVLSTPVTGDQGADLIATQPGMRVVVQCKFYSQPVGNKAVQEVFAAKRFQQAQYAVVVTNNAFTPSARQLATTNDVLLIHHDQLGEVNKLLRNLYQARSAACD